MTVFDASALLAYLTGEPGADLVERALEESHPVCGAANWAEVAQKIVSKERKWKLARSLLLSHGLQIAPVTEQDAETAAHLWRRGSGLSLGDRLCLALAERLDSDVITADRAWGNGGRIRQIR